MKLPSIPLRAWAARLLLVALVALVAVTGAGPADASPASAPARRSLPTTLTISASPVSIFPGGHSTVSAELQSTASHAPIPGARIELWSSRDSGRTWEYYGWATSDAAGAASTTVSPVLDTVYQWRFAGDATHAASTSPVAEVAVTPYATAVSINAAPTNVAPGGTTTLSATLVRTADHAAAAGERLELYSSTDGGSTWISTRTVTTNSSGTASVTLSIATTTTYQWRFAGTVWLAPSASANATVTVTRHPTALAISATPASITAGGSTTLSATLTQSDTHAPLAAPITLFASTDGGSTWTAAGSATTNGSGSATLTKSPTATTTYQWRYAGAPSYEPSASPNVTVSVTRDPSALTIDAAPSSVAPGESATLSTVLSRERDHALVTGQPVTLWASTDGGTSWTAAGSATTDAAGAASLTTAPTTTTTYEWRFAGSVYDAPSTSPTVTVTVTVLPRPSTLTIDATPTTIHAGDSAELSTTLSRTADHAAASGKTVTLFASTDGGSTWAAAGSATTDSTGTATLTTSPDATTTYQWRFAGDADLAAATSVNQTVTLVPATVPTLTEHVSRHRLSLGDALRVTGSYSEPVVGTSVSLYRLTRTGRTLVGTTHLDARGHYRFRLHPRQRGIWRLRAEIVDSVTTDSPICRVRVH